MMNKIMLALVPLAALAALTACSNGAPGGENIPGDTQDKRPYDGISADETIRLIGNEPFWGGEVRGGTDAVPGSLHYTTPENIDGERASVTRFAGRGGLSFTGQLSGGDFTLVVTPGPCSDTMSDRQYPLVITLQLGEEIRSGCGWTETQPFIDAPEA